MGDNVVAPILAQPGAAAAIADGVNLATGGQEESPAQLCTEAQRMAPWLDLADALMGGTAAMRAAGEKYLPRWPCEELGRDINEPDGYGTRLSVATLFPAFRRTVVTLAAKPFSKPITINDDVPPALKELLKDVDLQGRNLAMVAAELMVLALRDGLAGIFVDHTVRPAEADTTIATDKALGMRPYWVPIMAKQFIGCRVDANMRITQLRLFETVNVDVGEFGSKSVQQIVVHRPGTWDRYRKNERTGRWEHLAGDEGHGTTDLADIVPFIPVYGERLGFMLGKSPLLELAYLNVKHWQSQSDQDHLLTIARVPILTLNNVEDKKFKLIIGGTVTKIPPGSELKYTEHTGAAIDAGKVSLDDLKEEMRQSGAEMLVLRPNPTTATEVASDNAVGMCALQEITQQLQDAINAALDITARRMSLPKGGTVKLFNDFGAATLAEASAQLLVQLTIAGGLSRQTLLNELKRRGILSDDVTWETEVDNMDSEGPDLPPPPPAAPAAPAPAAKPGAPTPPAPPQPRN